MGHSGYVPASQTTLFARVSLSLLIIESQNMLILVDVAAASKNTASDASLENVRLNTSHILNGGSLQSVSASRHS
jgi:hypothetical protein